MRYSLFTVFLIVFIGIGRSEIEKAANSSVYHEILGEARKLFPERYGSGTAGG